MGRIASKIGLCLALVTLLAVSFCACASDAVPGTAVVVSSVQFTKTESASRVVIALTGEPEYRLNPTTAPLTLQIDLGRTVLSPELPQFVPVNDGHVKGIEAFQYKADSAKVTIGLEPGMAYRVSTERTSGFAIVMEVFASGGESGLDRGAGKAP